MSVRRSGGVWIAGGSFLVAGVAAAGTVTLTPSRDNTLFESGTGDVSNAAGPHLYIGRTLRGERRRGLVRFDVSAIPAGAVIESVELSLSVNRGAGVGLSCGLYRLTSDWGQGTSNAGDPGGAGAPATPGDPTWVSSFFGSALWQQPGGDFAPAASGIVIMVSAGEQLVWPSSAGLVSDVQGWLDTPGQNFGWAVIGGEGTLGSAMRVNSMESLSGPPSLLVTFSTGPTCGTSDFNGDGDFGTDADIEAFFACLGGNCCGECFEGGSDFNGDGDFGTDQDIESFFRVLGGGAC
jgi:hypothetical protein